MAPQKHLKSLYLSDRHKRPFNAVAGFSVAAFIVLHFVPFTGTARILFFFLSLASVGRAIWNSRVETVQIFSRQIEFRFAPMGSPLVMRYAEIEQVDATKKVVAVTVSSEEKPLRVPLALFSQEDREWLVGFLRGRADATAERRSRAARGTQAALPMAS